MAKILFISINDVNCRGIRSLSASLKYNGHQSAIIFLKRCQDVEIKKPEKYDWVAINGRGKMYRHARGPEITNQEKKILLSSIKDIKPDLIGFTVTTPLKARNAEITKLIKQNFDIPIIWGGPEASIDPGDCLNYGDLVCVGEGEKPIVEIANYIDNKQDVRQAKNLIYLKNGQLIKNPLNQLIDNLDELPFKDVSPKNKFLIENNTLTKNFHEASDRKIFPDQRFHIMTSRGCPYHCAYCNENFFKKLYPSQNYLRKRSPANVIRELKQAKEMIDYRRVHFEDEIFSFDLNWLEEFKERYKKEINLPFICYVYPNPNIESQLKILKEMGLYYTCLALQSGSERINKEIFTRPFNQELYLKTANILKSLGIDYYVDVITYNPFETEKDLEATFNILAQLPTPFTLYVNKLYILKGTRIYDLFQNFKTSHEKKLADKIFNYYAYLFFFTPTSFRRLFLKFIQKIKNYPRLIIEIMTPMFIANKMIIKIKNSETILRLRLSAAKTIDSLKNSSDKKIGQMGIFLKNNFPRLYFKLKK